MGSGQILTKKKRKEIIRKLISKHKIDERFSDANSKLFSELCRCEFEWVERVKPAIGKGVAVRVSWPAKQYIGPWSWVKNVDGYSHRKNLVGAMRATSRSGTFQGITKDICVECGSDSRLGVDHKSTPFCEIVESFISEHSEPDIEYGNTGWQLVSPKAFLEFHDSVADYQVLCISCNSKKGAR